MVNVNSYTLVITFTKPFYAMEMFYLTTHSTHFIYGYMASDGSFICTIPQDSTYLGNRVHSLSKPFKIVRKETCCRHMGYSF